MVSVVGTQTWYWRRQWHPTLALLPGKSHGRRSLVGCSPWGREESDMTERLHFHFSLFTFMHWRRKWQPTPVFLPGESQGQGSLVGCCLWGRAESGTTEATRQQQQRRKWHHLQYSGLRNPRDRGAWWATVQKQGISDGRKQSQGS